MKPLPFVESPYDGEKYFSTPVQGAISPIKVAPVPLEFESSTNWVWLSVRIDSQIDFFPRNVLWAFGGEGVLPCDISPTPKNINF